MFKAIGSITWKQFLLLLTIVTGIYYTIVIAFYYRNEFLSWSRKLMNARQRNDSKESNPDYDEFMQAAGLANILRDKMSIAIQQNTIKEELLFEIQTILRNYPQLKNTAFQIAIDNVIEQTISEKSPFTLTKVELGMLWNG